MADSSSIDQSLALMQASADLYNVMANERNYKNQQEVQEYMRDLQQTIFNREDTAIQRRMEDMKKAGLNPNLAAGNGANAGQAIKLEPAQRQHMNVGQVLDTMRTYQEVQTQRQNLKILQQDERAKKIENWKATLFADAEMQERVLKLTDYFNAQQYLMYGDKADFISPGDLHDTLKNGSIKVTRDDPNNEHYRDYIATNYRTLLANAEFAERQVGLQDVNVLLNVLSSVFSGVKLIK